MEVNKKMMLQAGCSLSTFINLYQPDYYGCQSSTAIRESFH